MALKVVTPHEKINALDLEPIKFLMMNSDSFPGWSKEMADHIAELYRSFLYLLYKYPDEAIHPTAEIDVFWHGHILDSEKYMADCDDIFGRTIHHWPYAGLLGNESIAENESVMARTLDLVRAEFPELAPPEDDYA